VSQIAIADVNSDGRLDVAAANQWYGSKGVAGILLNKGDGTLLPVREFYPGIASRYVALSDLTGDGRPELVASGLYNKMVVYLNNSAPWSTLTSLTSSGTPSYINQPVTLTANLCNAGCVPDGEPVAFYDGTNLIGRAITLNGLAKFTLSSLRVGAHSIKSIYPGDASWKPASAVFKQSVVKYPTTSTLISNNNSSNYGDTVTFTATVISSGGPTPTGRVTFKDGTISLHTVSLSGGVATLTTSKLAWGTHAVTVHYLGDGYNNTSTSAVLNQLVK